MLNRWSLKSKVGVATDWLIKERDCVFEDRQSFAFFF